MKEAGWQGLNDVFRGVLTQFQETKRKMGVKAGQARRGNTAWLVLHLLIYKKFILKTGKDDIKISSLSKFKY